MKNRQRFCRFFILHPSFKHRLLRMPIAAQEIGYLHPFLACKLERQDMDIAAGRSDFKKRFSIGHNRPRR